MSDAASATVRIVLADDHAMVRSGIKALLGQIEGVVVVGEAQDGEELIRQVGMLVPDMVLTDLCMPRLDGLAAIASIDASHPRVRLLVLSMQDSLASVRKALGCGACGYLMKNASTAELRDAIRGVMTSGSYFGASVAQLLLEPAPAEGDALALLTARQLQVVQLTAQGHACKRIAFDLGLSSSTVHIHLSLAMKKLGLGDIASLTRYALRAGLVTA